MKMNSYIRTTLLATSCLSLVACDFTGTAKTREIDAQNRILAEKADLASDVFRSRDARRGGGTQVSDGVFVAAVREKSNSTALLPARLQSPNAIVFNSRDELSLEEIAERLTKITGLEHVTALGPIQQSASTSGGAADDAGNPGVLLPPDIAPAFAQGPEIGEGPEPGTQVMPQQTNTTRSGLTVRPNFSGKLSDVLDEISSQFGVEWTYSEGQIIFRDYVTRQYQIPVIPSAAGGGSTVGGSTSAYTADFWADFELALDGIMPSEVSYTISRTTGLLTVTSRVSDHAKVRAFVEEIVKNMTQQIAFDVNVLSVAMRESSGRSLNLSAAINDASGNSLSFDNSTAFAESTGGMNLSIIDGQVSLEAIVGSLSKQGSVSIDTRTGVTTLNNRPVPVEVVDTVSYIASVTSETNEAGVTTLVPQPETQDVGFNLQIYPRIMNYREIMVEYSIELSELQGLESFGTGSTQVQLPEISRTNFSQQTILENGQTLILSGFERSRKTFDRRRSGDGPLGFSGSTEASDEKVATVIMIRPRILKSSQSIGTGKN